MRSIRTGRTVAALLCFSAPAAYADAAAEKYVDDALPLMYHTCLSVVEENNGDVAAIEDVVRALVAVSLYNREVDVSTIAATEAEKTALRDRFIADLRDGCEADNSALLAGVVDHAVATALSRQ